VSQTLRVRISGSISCRDFTINVIDKGIVDLIDVGSSVNEAESEKAINEKEANCGEGGRRSTM
jgi:hypothetical protein